MGREVELIKAAKMGDLRTLERHLVFNKRSTVIGSMKKWCHPNVQDEVGHTLLHHATLNGHREIVSFLLRCGASTTLSDSSGSYPLHLASWKGDLEIVKLLVQQGPSRANVNQQSLTDDTALHMAAQYGYVGVVEFLLEHHAHPMVKNLNGETPLDLAAQFGHVDTVHILISHCPEILRLSRPEISPLHLAAKNGHSVVVLSLINAGIPVNTLCNSGSALHEAALCGKEETVRLLLDKGIDTTLKNKENKTVLEMLAEYPAEQSRRIQSIIRDHISYLQYRPKTRYMKPRSHRLFAMATHDRVRESHDGRDSLQYKKDDIVLIQGRKSPDLLIGELDGATGSFPIKDFKLFQDIDGQMYEMAPQQLMESEEGNELVVKRDGRVKSQCESFPSPPLRKLKSSESSARPNSSPNIRDHRASSKKKKHPKMSDQQKKLVISKDKGNYAQLNPVSAETAKNSQSVEIAQVKHGEEEAGITIPPTDDGNSEQKFLGSYYLLEIGNFGTPPASPTGASQPQPLAEEQRPSSPGRTLLDVVGGIEVSVTGGIEVSVTGGIEVSVGGSPASARRPHYENVQPDTDDQAKLRSHSDPQEASPPPIPTKKRARSFRLGAYENVCPAHDQTDGFDVDMSPTNLSLPHPCRPEPVPVQDPIPIDLSPPRPCPLEVVPVQESQHEQTTTTEQTDSEDAADSPRFKIAQQYYRDGYEDVMVSRLNPNYQKVVLKGRQQPASQTGTYAEINDLQNGLRRDISPEGHCGVWIIPSHDDPFAGLVQSSSVVDKDQIPSPRGRLMSVWDENRVSEEWKSVDSVMQGVSQVIIDYESTLPALARHSLEKLEEEPSRQHSAVALWLSGLGLGGYTAVIESNGFDHIQFLGGGIMEIDDLRDIGITDSNEVHTIMAAANILTSPPRVRQCQTLSEWLQLLNLSHLEPRFEGYSLSKVATFWDVQLTSVLGIEQLGYRKRLLYGIQELRKGHPEWARSSLLRIGPEQSTPSASSPGRKYSFLRDYRNIRSTRKVKSVAPQPDDHTSLFASQEYPSSVQRLPRERRFSESSARVASPHSETQWTESPLRRSVKEQTNPHSPPGNPVRGEECPPASLGKANPDSKRSSMWKRMSAKRSSKKQQRQMFSPPPPDARNYHTWYLGSALVKGNVGKHSAEEACLKLRTATDGIAKIPQIILSVSWKGIKFVDAVSKMVVSNHLIQDISHCCSDIEDQRVFAYMTKDKDVDKCYCHVFMVQSQDIADEIVMTICQAFQVAYQAVVRTRGPQRTDPPHSSPSKSLNSEHLSPNSISASSTPQPFLVPN